jgi:hypothetical protein
MVDYKKGKIYEIVCRNTGRRYIGSTVMPLVKRLATHRSKCHRKIAGGSSSKIIIEGGDFYINLLEDCPCDNREQLLGKEREWYNKTECVNIRRPLLTDTEKQRLEYFAAYRKTDEYKIRNDAYNQKRRDDKQKEIDE